MDFVPLCAPWPASWCDGQLTPTATGAPLMAASELLWEYTGRQFGSCEVLVRPCRRACRSDWGSTWWWDGPDWPSSSWPAWLDVACGLCVDGCSCSSVSTMRLPQPVQSIVSVVIDGETLPASGYSLYDGRLLVKTEGEWPLCQDWTVPVSGVGAWHVVGVFGWPVPILGQMAVAELASEIDKACRGAGDCNLSTASVESITRAGVTKRFVSGTDLRAADLVGLRLADRFLRAVNPTGIRVGARIWTPDDMASSRRPGGVP